MRNFENMELLDLLENVDVQEAFAEIEARFIWLIKSKIFSLGIKPSDDMLQEGRLALFDAAKTYKSDLGASFKTYAGVCIYNRLSNMVREKKNVPLSDFLSIEELSAQDKILVDSPEVEFEKRENYEAVLSKIHITLSDFECKVLALYLSGYKRSEIQEKFSISIKAYDNAIARVRKKLKANPFL